MANVLFHLECNIWGQDWFAKLSTQSRCVFLYLLTNSNGPQSRTLYDIDDMITATGLLRNDLIQSIKELHYGYIIFSEYPKETDRLLSLYIYEDSYCGKPVTLSNDEIQRVRSGLTAIKKQEIHERFNHKCVYCGELSEEIDHIVPISRGGTNDDNNLVAACMACNRSKSDKILSELGWELLIGEAL